LPDFLRNVMLSLIENGPDVFGDHPGLFSEMRCGAHASAAARFRAAQGDNYEARARKRGTHLKR